MLINWWRPAGESWEREEEHAKEVLVLKWNLWRHPLGGAARLRRRFLRRTHSKIRNLPSPQEPLTNRFHSCFTSPGTQGTLYIHVMQSQAMPAGCGTWFVFRYGVQYMSSNWPSLLRLARTHKFKIDTHAQIRSCLADEV